MKILDYNDKWHFAKYTYSNLIFTSHKMINIFCMYENFFWEVVSHLAINSHNTEIITKLFEKLIIVPSNQFYRNAHVSITILTFFRAKL